MKLNNKAKVIILIKHTWHKDVDSIGLDLGIAHWHSGQPFSDCAKPMPDGQSILHENGGHRSLHSQTSQPNRSFK